jgi:RimJ/RimL family protein N-acetyltransferase
VAVVLRTARLALRTWTPSDAEAAFAVYGDPLVMLHTRAPPWPDVAAARARLAALALAIEERGFGHWAVVEEEGGALVGSAGFRPGFDAGELEVGFTIARSRWGRGYATEIAAATLRLGFERFGAPRVWALAAPGNGASRRVLEKIGMRFTRELEDEGARWAAYCAAAT